MSCCHKYYPIFGIISGTIYTLVFLGWFIYLLHTCFTTERCEIPGVVMILAAALISALYIWAIVKKYSNLIIPWIMLSFFIVLLTSCATFLYAVAAAWHGASDYFITSILVVGVCALIFEIASFCISFHLYSKIDRENYMRAENSSPNESSFV